MINGYITPRKSKKKRENIGLLVGAILSVPILVWGHKIFGENEKKLVEKEAIEYASPMEILDADKNNILSQEEKERFYQVTKLDSKTTPFEAITREQWNYFLMRDK